MFVVWFCGNFEKRYARLGGGKGEGGGRKKSLTAVFIAMQEEEEALGTLGSGR
jgi:hypothetical protein